MQRCFQLAKKGLGSVSPNPMVGAVLVHNNEIIGEGYHAMYGQAHAEVNCFDSIQEENRHRVDEATLYVSLEPCAHYGKTPPCTQRILHEGVKRVVIANADPFIQVNGKGIALLQQAGVEVICGVEERAGEWLNRRFFTYVKKQRPYIVLKWAESADGFIGRHGERIAISNSSFHRLVHQWRMEEDAIMIGANTLHNDDPSLTNRYWPGKQPMRVVMDRKLSFPEAKLLHDNTAPVIIFNEVKEGRVGRVQYILLPNEAPLQFVMQQLYAQNIGSVLVEGGAALHASFIREDLYDEVRVLKNDELLLHRGVAATQIHQQSSLVQRIGNTSFHQWPTP